MAERSVDSPGCCTYRYARRSIGRKGIAHSPHREPRAACEQHHDENKTTTNPFQHLRIASTGTLHEVTSATNMQDNFTFRRPTAEELQRAHGKTVPDLIRPDLKVLFCGINPGLYSGATGLHFARPGNRFWPALFAAGFTDRLLHPSEREELLSSGYGITAIVRRATATAAELDDDEYRSGRIALEKKVRKFKPRWVAILGLGAFRTGFDKPRAKAGRQEERIAESGLWVLPNPSGLNANHQLPQLTEMFRELRLASE
jgi:double-stranded uracil-DNA glycosylase